MAKILVVDDRAINREFLVALLGYAGHEVFEAGDGRQALEAAKQIDPDLIITDVLMPTMDGIEFTRRLGAEPELNSVPVIFYTATYRLTEARAMADTCGVTTIIPKPSDPDEVLAAVQGELGLATPPLPAATVREFPVGQTLAGVDRLFATSAGELSSLQSRIQSALESDDSPSGAARQLQLISADLDASLTRAQGLSMRLAALVELGLELGTRRDPAEMLGLFCRAARDIMNVRFAVVCMLDDAGEVAQFASWGFEPEQAAAVLRGIDPMAGVLGHSLAEAEVRRHAGLEGRHEAVGLPGAHPTIDDLLVLSLRSAQRTYGWFYVADPVGGRSFTTEDGELAETLAAQLVPAYENLVLLDRLDRHASLLAVEVDERRRALDELSESERRFRQLAESVREVFFLVDVRTRSILYVSPTYEEVWERSCESLYRDSASWLDVVHAEDRRRVATTYFERPPGPAQTIKFRIVVPSGTRWIKAQTFAVRDDGGHVSRIAGIAEDVTASELQDRKIRRLSRIRAVLGGINSAIVRIQDRGALLDEACRIAVDHGGFPVAWFVLVQPGNHRIELVAFNGSHPATGAVLSSALVEEVTAQQGIVEEALRSKAHVVANEIRPASGTGRSFGLALENRLNAAIALPLLADDEAAGAVVFFAADPGFFDEQEVRLLDELAADVGFALKFIAREERLKYLAFYDALTDLPNTALLQEQLGAALRDGRNACVALFLIDVDRFTDLNDTLGRHVGDKLLAEVGQRLKRTLARRGIVARVGSDTFAAAITGLARPEEAGSALQDSILAAFSRPFAPDGRELHVSARVGAAFSPADGNDADVLLKNAEVALMEAKSTGARYQFYSSNLNARVAEEFALEQRLVRAVQNEEFVLYYQPKIDSHTGGIVGLEALLRWQSPDAGLVLPGDFIEVLESSDMILDVGSWVIDRMLEEHAAWARAGLSPPRVAVNVSPLQLRYPDFADMVLGKLEREGADPSALELEITESVIMTNIESTIGHLDRLAEHGVSLAIDDFGTGYSSLYYLAKLPVHSLKIDRSFVVKMTADSGSMTLVSSVISLAHSLGLVVVAEGVDSEDQAKFLRLMNCDMMQGYLFGRPAPAATIAKLLARSR